MKPNERVSIGLDTKSSGDAGPELRPQSPVRTFVPKAHDDFVVIEQKFDIEKAPPLRSKGHIVRGGATRI